VLLCSDGLTKGVRPAAILASLTRAEDMTTLSEDLIALANNAGGEDNTTVIVLSVSDAPEMNLWHQLRDRLAI